MTAVKVRVIDTFEKLRESRLSIESLPLRSEPRRFLMCEPRYFQVVDSKNPHMKADGNPVNKDEAIRQWSVLKQTVERLGYPVYTVSPQPGLEDMVFAANQALPGIDKDNRHFVIPSRMVHPSRRKEVPHYISWYSEQGYRVVHLDDTASDRPYFEGQGDAIWHPGRQLLWGACGYRSESKAFDLIQSAIDVPVIRLKLIDPRFYHLDTCFCVLNEESVLIYSDAFDAEGLRLIKALFNTVIDAPREDACNFACNAIALGGHVLLQEGSPTTCRLLRENGFEPIELDSSEFTKSGGSLFCMKVQVY